MTLGGIARRVRIVWTIAVKDILDSVRNRNTLAILLSVVFIVVMYQLPPLLDEESHLSHVAVYDASRGAGQALVEALEEQPDLRVRTVASSGELELWLTEFDQAGLGLVFPAGLGSQLAGETPLTFAGYYVHWADPAQVRRLETMLETRLAELTGVQVDVVTTGKMVYTTKNSESEPFLKSLTALIVLTVIGVSLVPNLLEEEKRTRTMELLLLSPATPGEVVLGKALTGLFYSLSGAAIVLVINFRLVTQWWLAVVAIAAGALFFVGLGLLVGALVDNRQQLMIAAWVLITPLVMLAVIYVMDEIFPAGLINVARWAPTSLFVTLLRASFSNDGSLSTFGPELVGLIAYDLAVLGGVSWALRRYNR